MIFDEIEVKISFSNETLVDCAMQWWKNLLESGLRCKLLSASADELRGF